MQRKSLPLQFFTEKLLMFGENDKKQQYKKKNKNKKTELVLYGDSPVRYSSSSASVSVNNVCFVSQDKMIKSHPMNNSNSQTVKLTPTPEKIRYKSPSKQHQTSSSEQVNEMNTLTTVPLIDVRNWIWAEDEQDDGEKENEIDEAMIYITNKINQKQSDNKNIRKNLTFGSKSMVDTIRSSVSKSIFNKKSKTSN